MDMVSSFTVLVWFYSLPQMSITCTVWGNLSTSILQSLLPSHSSPTRPPFSFRHPMTSWNLIWLVGSWYYKCHPNQRAGWNKDQEVRRHETKQNGNRVWFSQFKHMALPHGHVCSWPQIIDLARVCILWPLPSRVIMLTESTLPKLVKYCLWPKI